MKLIHFNCKFDLYSCYLFFVICSYCAFLVHTFGLLDIPSQFTPQVCDHLYFSHSPDCPKYFVSSVLMFVHVVLTPFIFLHVFPSSSITQLSGQFAITGGHSPIVFAFIIEYATTAKNPRSSSPAIISTMRWKFISSNILQNKWFYISIVFYYYYYYFIFIIIIIIIIIIFYFITSIKYNKK